MSEIAITQNSAALLDNALDAAGGLDRWREHSFLSAHLSQGGGLWGMKGQAGVLDDVRVDVALHQEWVSHHPFAAPELRSSFTPRRVEIRTGDGAGLETLDDPRRSFSTHAADAPWTRLQLAYFVGTAMWTYLTQPFCLSLPGFRVNELSPWEEGGKVLRRLRVDWPNYLASHSSTQTHYFDNAGRLARPTTKWSSSREPGRPICSTLSRP
jgi:hypothetical protein